MIKYLLGMLKYFFYRNVSFGALVTNDSVISRKARINRKVKVFRSEIGDYSYVGRNSSLVCASVGKFCSIACDCVIGAGKHTLDNISTSPIFTEQANGTGYSWIEKSVVDPCPDVVEIGNDVWIGARAMVIGNVKIGDGAVIAAGAVVTKDIPSYAVAGGVPAKVIKYRFEPQVIGVLRRLRWWDMPSGRLRKSVIFFQRANVSKELIEELEQSLK